MLCQIRLHSLGKFAAGQHHSSSTARTFQPDIRAETRDNPFIGATRVLFSEAETIIQTQVG